MKFQEGRYYKYTNGDNYTAFFQVAGDNTRRFRIKRFMEINPIGIESSMTGQFIEYNSPLWIHSIEVDKDEVKLAELLFL
jgi:hypothetical protein